MSIAARRAHRRFVWKQSSSVAVTVLLSSPDASIPGPLEMPTVSQRPVCLFRIPLLCEGVFRTQKEDTINIRKDQPTCIKYGSCA